MEKEKNLTESILEKVKADIDTHLPAQVGASLKTRLERCDDLEILTKNQSTKIERLEDNIKDRDKELGEKDIIINEFKNRESDLIAGEKELATSLADLESRERNLQLDLLKTKLEASEQSRNDIFTLTEKVFSIPSVKVSNNKHTQPVYNDDEIDQYGNYRSKMVGTEIFAEETTTSVSK